MLKIVKVKAIVHSWSSRLRNLSVTTNYECLIWTKASWLVFTNYIVNALPLTRINLVCIFSPKLSLWTLGESFFTITSWFTSSNCNCNINFDILLLHILPIKRITKSFRFGKNFFSETQVDIAEMLPRKGWPRPIAILRFYKQEWIVTD
jgi:hypothetical protein